MFSKIFFPLIAIGVLVTNSSIGAQTPQEDSEANGRESLPINTLWMNDAEYYVFAEAYGITEEDARTHATVEAVRRLNILLVAKARAPERFAPIRHGNFTGITPIGTLMDLSVQPWPDQGKTHAELVTATEGRIQVVVVLFVPRAKFTDEYVKAHTVDPHKPAPRFG